MWDKIGLWVNALLTIAIISFAVPGENILYRFAEYTMIGITAGYAMVQGLRVILNLGVMPVASGNVYLLLPILMGLLVYARFSREHSYMSRWPMAVMVGSGIGVSIRAIPEVNILRQVQATFLPIVGVDPYTAFSNLVLIVTCLTTMYYFFMTLEPKSNLKYISTAGRYSLMVLFGAYWGSQLMTRSTMFIGRMSFLLRDWLLPLLGI